MLQSSISVIGQGRMGIALAAALGAPAPLGRGSDGGGAEIVLLCVPDSEIAAAAACVAADGLVGHCSGATTLAPLAPHEAFSLHPLMTVPSDPAHTIDFAGVSCAVAGLTPRALETARALATRLAMTPIEVDDGDRAAYHAAASIASNFLVTLETAAERLLATTGIAPASRAQAREALLPLVRATVENWAATGERALTGPIARGDEETVTRQRGAVAERAPELLDLFDTLAAATRDLPLVRA